MTSTKHSREHFMLRSLLDISTALHRVQVQVIDMRSQMAQQPIASVPPLPATTLQKLSTRLRSITKRVKAMRLIGWILGTQTGQWLMALLGAIIGERYLKMITKVWRWLWGWVELLSSAGIT